MILSNGNILLDEEIIFNNIVFSIYIVAPGNINYESISICKKGTGVGSIMIMKAYGNNIILCHMFEKYKECIPVDFLKGYNDNSLIIENIKSFLNKIEKLEVFS